MTLRALFHVNHLWGAGHYARIAALADAVVAAGGAATIMTGNTPLAGRSGPGVHVIELPPLRAPDPSYARLVTASGGAPDDAYWAARSALIDAALAETRPDVLVTETFPFGRRKLSRELLRLVDAAKSGGAQIVASLRDLPTPPADARRLDECADRLRAHYDAVLVHGDPSVFGVNEIWPGEIPAPTYVTGFVVAPPPPGAGARRGVIVSAGGGGDAAPLLRTALAARRSGLLAEEDWTLVAGPAAPEALVDALAMQLPPRTVMLRSMSDLPQRLAAARLAVGRGGYNSVIETVAAGTPLVAVPFAPEGEPEQAIRAARFADLGLLVHLPESGLTAATLAAAAERALARPPPSPCPLALDGAARSAALLAEIVGGG